MLKLTENRWVNGPAVALLALLSAIALAIAFAISSGDEADATVGRASSNVRIVAFKHGDGRIEFGLQQWDYRQQQWGDRMLPRARTLRTSAPSGRWLLSSSIPLEFEGHVMHLPIRSALYQSISRPGLFSGGDSGFRTDANIVGHSGEYIVTRAFATGATNIEGLLLTLSLKCTEAYTDWGRVDDDNNPIEVPAVFASTMIMHDDQAATEYEINPSAGIHVTALNRDFGSGLNGYEPTLDVPLEWNFANINWLSQDVFAQIRAYKDLTVSFQDTRGQAITASFAVSSLETPILPNFTYCGQY